jgi:hypothetical protein
MVELHLRIAAWAVALTTAAVFPTLVFLVPFVKSLSLPGQLASLATAALGSSGAYRFIVTGLFWVFGRIALVRRWILGAESLEGTWVGRYVRNGEARYTIECIDQSTGETRIEGREFDGSCNTRATWFSEAVFVDVRRSQLVYAYTCDVFEKQHQQHGIGFFRIIRRRMSDGGDKLDGYAVDMVDGMKDPNTEYRVSEGFLSDADALLRAKALFEGGERK